MLSNLIGRNAAKFNREIVTKFLSTSAYNQSIRNVNQEEKSVSVHFNDESVHKYHYVWLRDHCRCQECYNHVTQQRQVDTYKIPLNIYPSSINFANGNLQVNWPDKHISEYQSDWLQEKHYGQTYSSTLLESIEPIFWGAEIKEDMPQTLSYEEVLQKDESLLRMLQTIEQYGFTIVTESPTTLPGLRKLADRISAPLQTFYDDVYEVTNQDEDDMDHQDTAYLNIQLNAHNDGTYFNDSPGLQFFHCHSHIGEGGETLLVDGIGSAEKLKQTHLEAFKFLSTTPLPARYYEHTYTNNVLAPMIKVDPYSKKIYQVRINGDDRDILSCLQYDDVERFYDALRKLNHVLRDEQSELWFKLTPGNVLIVNNWRVLHGRASFTGTRTLSGCYVKKDDYLSKLRLLQKQYKS